jgi:hypothetical protein
VQVPPFLSVGFWTNSRKENDMARYAEWNKFIGTLKTDPWGVTNVDEIVIAFEKSAADVAPKSEVAREIFEEIENSTSPMLGLEDDKEYVAILATTFAELKKKYTEGE